MPRNVVTLTPRRFVLPMRWNRAARERIERVSAASRLPNGVRCENAARSRPRPGVCSATMREGGCSCGEVRYRLTAEPLFVHCCHCLNCQRQTGSAFVVNVLVEADRVEPLVGQPEPVDVPRDGDAPPQQIFRCPRCQIAVYSVYSNPAIRFVRAGTLDDPSSVAPDVHIFTRSKLPWVVLPEDVPAFDVYYDRDSLWPQASLDRLRALA